jgi:hypothetical protein
VIPVLTPPDAGVRSAGPGTWLPRVFGLVLLLVALTGAYAWVTALSPFPLERWRAIDMQHAVTITRPGTYVIFEEGDGAATTRREPGVTLIVRSIANRQVALRSLIDTAGRSPQTYDLQIHEGRAIAAIDFDRPGRYLIQSYPSGERDRFRNPSELPGLAFGAEGEPSAWGSWGGLLVLAGIPALAGAAVLTVARLERPLGLGPLVRPRDTARY